MRMAQQEPGVVTGEVVVTDILSHCVCTMHDEKTSSSSCRAHSSLTPLQHQKDKVDQLAQEVVV